MTQAKELRTAIIELDRFKRELQHDVKAELRAADLGTAARMANDPLACRPFREYVEAAARVQKLGEQMIADLATRLEVPVAELWRMSREDWAVVVDLATTRIAELKKAQLTKLTD